MHQLSRLWFLFKELNRWKFSVLQCPPGILTASLFGLFFAYLPFFVILVFGLFAAFNWQAISAYSTGYLVYAVSVPVVSICISPWLREWCLGATQIRFIQWYSNRTRLTKKELKPLVKRWMQKRKQLRTDLMVEQSQRKFFVDFGSMADSVGMEQRVSSIVNQEMIDDYIQIQKLKSSHVNFLYQGSFLFLTVIVLLMILPSQPKIIEVIFCTLAISFLRALYSLWHGLGMDVCSLEFLCNHIFSNHNGLANLREKVRDYSKETNVGVGGYVYEDYRATITWIVMWIAFSFVLSLLSPVFGFLFLVLAYFELPRLINQIHRSRLFLNFRVVGKVSTNKVAILVANLALIPSSLMILYAPFEMSFLSKWFVQLMQQYQLHSIFENIALACKISPAVMIFMMIILLSLVTKGRFSQQSRLVLAVKFLLGMNICLTWFVIGKVGLMPLLLPWAGVFSLVLLSRIKKGV
jgi:hypothetical protein